MSSWFNASLHQSRLSVFELTLSCSLKTNQCRSSFFQCLTLSFLLKLLYVPFVRLRRFSSSFLVSHLNNFAYARYRPRLLRCLSISCLLRKEVIQPHLPIRLPCYDFTPVIDFTLDACLLAVSPAASGALNSHGVTGGVYKARERIHRGILIREY